MQVSPKSGFDSDTGFALVYVYPVAMFQPLFIIIMNEWRVGLVATTCVCVCVKDRAWTVINIDEGDGFRAVCGELLA